MTALHDPDVPPPEAMKHVLTVLAGGGFTFETRVLLQSLEDRAKFTYLGQPMGGRPGVDGMPAGDWHEVPMFATVTEPSKMASIRAFAVTFRKALALLRAERIDAVIGVGCSHAVPLFLAARLLGRKTIFVESITRADRLSQTGQLVYALRLANLIVVQWPELAKRFPRARLGTIL